MSLESCKNLLLKAAAIVVGAAALAGTLLLVLGVAGGRGPLGRPHVAAAARPQPFLPSLGSLVRIVDQVHARTVRAHVRAVRRRYDPKPRTRSSATISLYERTTSAVVVARQGCLAAKRGAIGVVVLDFGKPAYVGHGFNHGYGTIDFSDRYLSDHRITIGMLGWARGYVRCLPRRSRAVVTLARGTSNYSPSVPSAWAAGQRWGRAVIALGRKLHRQGFSAHVRSAAADDAEPAWDRGFRQTQLFIHGYRRYASGRTLYDYGSLDGGVGSIWNARQMMYVTGGAGHTAVLPEIYYPSLAREWAQFAYVAHRQFHRRIHFAGVMTQVLPGCHRCGLGPHAARRALVGALASWGASRTPVPRGGTNIVRG